MGSAQYHATTPCKVSTEVWVQINPVSGFPNSSAPVSPCSRLHLRAVHGPAQHPIHQGWTESTAASSIPGAMANTQIHVVSCSKRVLAGPGAFGNSSVEERGPLAFVKVVVPAHTEPATMF